MTDFDTLLAHARHAMTLAYARYSNYQVGCAAEVDDGRIITGCNVENASLGLTLCAECGLVSELIRGGGGKLVRFVCVGPAGEIITPCGRCRQLLVEHAAPEMELWLPAGVVSVAEMLPGAFTPADLLAAQAKERKSDD